MVKTCDLAVIWIDWYAYHVARFKGLAENGTLANRVAGIELVGGIGVHAGLKFREEIPAALNVQTLLPEASWQQASGWELARRLWRQLSRLQPSSVLVPGYYTLPAIAAAVWSKLHRATTVLMSESTEHDHERIWWKEAVKKLLLHALFDRAVVGGSAHRRYLMALGFPASRIARFYDVVDNAFFSERCRALRDFSAPNEFDLPEHYFLSVGRLATEKNVDGLLSAYFAYRQSGGTWSLVVVGDGPQKKRLQEMAAASGFGKDIFFPGLKSTAELPQYYAFAECFVLPSTREPWGLVANEAMASGLPVIVSQACGCSEDLVVEGENGFTFDPTKADSLLCCLRTVSSLTGDERKRMSARSSEIIAKFSTAAWATEVARIADL